MNMRRYLNNVNSNQIKEIIKINEHCFLIKHLIYDRFYGAIFTRIEKNTMWYVKSCSKSLTFAKI